MTTRTRIKICGITNLEDAQAAVEYGADALGFIFVSNTPRYVGDNFTFLNQLIRLPPFISRVAVYVDKSENKAGKQALKNESIWFNTIQLYSNHWEFGKFPALPTLQVVQAFPIKDVSSLNLIADSLAALPTLPHALLLDTYHKDKLGGSGETFSWELAVEAKQRFGLPIILAGGLTPENVGEAVRTVRPYAVDVSSGVEASPGRKDHAKIRAFVEAVREADNDSMQHER